MITRAWRRLGVSPFAMVLAGLAALALLLSRGAGSGWLVVVAAAYLGVLAVAAMWSLAGVVGVAVDVSAPSDAIVGETYALDVRVRRGVPHLRTVALVNLSSDAVVVAGNDTARLRVVATRRCMVRHVRVEVRGGLPLGLFRLARAFDVPLPVPLAVAPVPASVSLLDALGEDAGAEVRTVRAYVPGDPARLVHWRSTARRGELMVRELESAELLRGAALVVRVSLPSDDTERAEAIASEAGGLSIAAIDAGIDVVLATYESDGVVGPVTTRRAVGRRLAAALPGVAPATTAGERTHVVELPR